MKLRKIGVIKDSKNLFVQVRNEDHGNLFNKTTNFYSSSNATMWNVWTKNEMKVPKCTKTACCRFRIKSHIKFLDLKENHYKDLT